MGGHRYEYLVAYDPDIRAALERLRAEVFREGKYDGAERKPRSPEAAVKQSGESGTRSILDIVRVTSQPDSSCVAPLREEELAQYFGTDLPTLSQVEESDDFWADMQRGQARCLVVLDGGIRKLFFCGYSFD